MTLDFWAVNRSSTQDYQDKSASIYTPMNNDFSQITLTLWGKITVQLVFSLTGLDLTEKENRWFCFEVESELVRLETSLQSYSPPNGECSLLYPLIYLFYFIVNRFSSCNEFTLGIDDDGDQLSESDLANNKKQKINQDFGSRNSE